MSDVLITRRVPQVGVDLLTSAGLAPDILQTDLPVARVELLAQLKANRYKAVLSTMSEQVDEEFLSAAGESLQIVANFAVGYNNIDLEACKAKGIKVSNTPGVLSEATADQAFALLLAAARRVVEGHKMVEAGTWEGWTPTQLLGQDLSGRTMGIIGMGRIGRAFAQRAKGFNMKLVYHNRSRDAKAEAELGANYLSLDALLAESDFISLHTPLTDETRHLLCYEQFKKMKKTAIVINTARGPIIHEKALVKALQEKWIWAAGLDVFEFEPEVTKELLSMPNVVLAPHLGSATEGTRDAMISLAANAIIQVLKGQRPENLILG